LTELVALWNGDNPHEALVCLRARGLLEFVPRSPINELGPASIFTHTGIVAIRLDLVNFIGPRFNGGGIRGVVITGPQAIFIRVTDLARG
jgi:hypothetical protein